MVQNLQSVSVDVAKLKKIAQAILLFLEYKSFDLAIQLVDDQTMQDYNRRFRNTDKPTDVLSFPFYPDLKAGERIVARTKDDKNLGDLVIAPRYVQNNLEQWQQTFEYRLAVLLVHGICHLLGYDHIEDADYEIMNAQEQKILTHLKQVGLV
ncbi:rRNA maturation RNase YbeY [bacterium]|nr:MAG: rRNA maturation RNase YbeY [bacterium]QQR62214.1 MAG: rRNA maturation RNase YbeY [bacterium]QQR63224.1 MAG: rRNA maturation RNase YbeY [bacterium]